MQDKDRYEYILIRDATVLVKLPKGNRDAESADSTLFDVRTGVKLREIHPPLQSIELQRGYCLEAVYAASIIKSEYDLGEEADIEFSKVVSISDVKQRKLDSVVAESILDQLRAVVNLMQQLLAIADSLPKAERFWLSQQILTFVRKFSGRELAELEDIIEWFKNQPRK